MRLPITACAFDAGKRLLIIFFAVHWMREKASIFEFLQARVATKNLQEETYALIGL